VQTGDPGKLHEALHEVRGTTSFFRFLGSYAPAGPAGPT